MKFQFNLLNSNLRHRSRVLFSRTLFSAPGKKDFLVGGSSAPDPAYKFRSLLV